MLIIVNVKVIVKYIVGFKELFMLDWLIGILWGELNLLIEVIVKLDDGSEMKLKVIFWDDDVSNYLLSSLLGIY